jgi:hypothetical protein
MFLCLQDQFAIIDAVVRILHPMSYILTFYDSSVSSDGNFCARVLVTHDYCNSFIKSTIASVTYSINMVHKNNCD